jgi:predicted dienelactone hydrolase
MSRSRMPGALLCLAAACLLAAVVAATARVSAVTSSSQTAEPAATGTAHSSAAATGTGDGNAAAPGAGDRFGPGPGAFAVEAMDLDWLDQDRNRPVPVRVYFPKHDPGPFPVVVFSSGLGAGRASFEFLGRHLASHGYVSVHVQHPGSDERIWQEGGDAREKVQRVVGDPRTGLARLLDLVFALDQVAALAGSSPVLRGRVDLREVAAAGSNLGAWTALSAAGLAITGKNGEESSLPDPRVKAALLLSLPPAPAPQREKLRFEQVKVPCLVVTGAPAGESEAQAAARRLPFDRIAGAERVLVTLLAPAAAGAARSGAAGSGGAGSGGGAAEARDRAAPATATAPADRRAAKSRLQAQLRDAVATASVAFLDAYLRHDAAAREWLRGGGLAARLGQGFRVETR